MTCCKASATCTAMVATADTMPESLTPANKDTRFSSYMHSPKQAAWMAHSRLLANHRQGWLAPHIMPLVPISAIVCLTGTTTCTDTLQYMHNDHSSCPKKECKSITQYRFHDLAFHRYMQGDFLCICNSRSRCEGLQGHGTQQFQTT